jgi:pimeloyl-ACP methyl ester carboxylesterase
MSRHRIGQSAALAAPLAALLMGLSSTHAQAAPIQNIVLVHGAFLDGSGWRPVYEILTRDGYHVSIVQEPLTGLADDVAATRRILDQQDGPVILVGHSYGGAIITEAGSHPKVVGLVYIAAHAPDEGETQSGNAQKYPALGRSAVTSVADGYVWIEPSRFHAEFSADLSAADAGFEARSQVPTAAIAFSTTITAPAWKAKPSWYMVAGADHIINPDLERMYAARAHSRKVVEVPGASHSVYRSHPEEVAALIEDAAHNGSAAQ